MKLAWVATLLFNFPFCSTFSFQAPWQAKKVTNVSTNGKDARPLYDPFGLYPPNAPERINGQLKPLEETETTRPSAAIIDPLNIYPNKAELSSSSGGSVAMSRALPFLERPALLDGTLPGDRGFDPFNFASTDDALQWQRLAEVKHARIAMLAAVGWVAAELWDGPLADLWQRPSLLLPDGRVPSVLNGGLDQTPLAFWAATLGVASAIECWGLLKEANARGKPYTPGALGFDPFQMKALTQEGRTYELEAELFNGRLAMLAVTMFAAQEWWTHASVVHNLLA